MALARLINVGNSKWRHVCTPHHSVHRLDMKHASLWFLQNRQRFGLISNLKAAIFLDCLVFKAPAMKTNLMFQI